MNESLYLSRSFVEFGPFPVAEMLSFHTRGLLKDSDYVRADSSADWIHVNDWAASLAPATPAPKATKVAAPKPAAKAAPTKAAPAKKAPAKKAAKKNA